MNNIADLDTSKHIFNVSDLIEVSTVRSRFFSTKDKNLKSEKLRRTYYSKPWKYCRKVEVA